MHGNGAYHGYHLVKLEFASGDPEREVALGRIPVKGDRINLGGGEICLVLDVLLMAYSPGLTEATVQVGVVR